MIYEELKIQLDLNKPVDVLKSIGKKTNDNNWFVICDEGDCHLFDDNGNEIDIDKIKILYEKIIPKDIKKIIIPDSIKSIGYDAFCGCINLTSVNIPDSVKNIEICAFYACINLKSLIFEEKTINQVKLMAWYPFGIKDESIIKCIS